MTTIHKYRIYNLDTGLEEFGWSQTAPTVPFSNSSQTLDPGSTVIVETIQNQTVAVVENAGETGGNYEVEGFSIIVAANSSQILSYSLPYPSIIMDITYESTLDMEGDIVNIITEPVIAGTLNANALINDTDIVVTPSVLTAVKRGMYITLDDGVNTDSLIRVISIDENTNTLTLENALSFNFNSGITTVAVQKYIAKNYNIGPPTKHVLGSGIIGGIHLPANNIVNIEYENNGGTSKTFYFNVQRHY